MPREKTRNEIIVDPLQNYECNIYNVILDTTVERITSRFIK